MRSRFCPYCRQEVRTERAGVMLTLLKAGIFDTIKASGDIGVSSFEIAHGPLYRDRGPVGITAIKAHVWQINQVIRDFVIVSDGRRWFLWRRRLLRQRRA
jgi:hypothetical protein